MGRRRFDWQPTGSCGISPKPPPGAAAVKQRPQKSNVIRCATATWQCQKLVSVLLRHRRSNGSDQHDVDPRCEWEEKKEEGGVPGQMLGEQRCPPSLCVTKEEKVEKSEDVMQDELKDTAARGRGSDTEIEPDTSVGLTTDQKPASPPVPREEASAQGSDPDTDVDRDAAMSGLNGLSVDYPDDEPLEADNEADMLSVYPPTHYDLGGGASNSSTWSIYPGDLAGDYVYENGRRYLGDFSMPNDELEQDRMRCLHQVYLHLFDFQLTTVELDSPTLILDIGTGTGDWAFEIAQKYPDCEVIGTDISDIQPTAVPHNVEFEVDDCQIEWNRPPTDLVHMRNMSGLIDDWSFIYNEAFTCLKPGGYIELLDFFGPREAAKEWFAHFPPESQVHRLLRAVDEAGRITGRRFGADHLTAELLGAAGFVDIEITDAGVDCHRDETVGQLWIVVCMLWMEAAYLRLLTSVLGWDPQEAKDVISAVNEEMHRMMMDETAQRDFEVKFRRAKARKPRDAPWPLPHSAVASVLDQEMCA